MTASTAVTSGAGAVSQPIFHPVVEKVLPPDEIDTVRSQAPGQGRDRAMRHPEGEVLVDLVGDDDRVVAGRELDHEFEDLVVEHRARRVVRRVDDDEPGAVGDRGAQFVGVGSPVGVAQRHRAVHAAGARDERRVRVVVGLERDDLVARVDEAPESSPRALRSRLP